MNLPLPPTTNPGVAVAKISLEFAEIAKLFPLPQNEEAVEKEE
jgi:hypothetical protein